MLVKIYNLLDKARLWYSLADTCLNVTSLAAEMRRGFVTRFLSPWPSWPCSPNPHEYNLPLSAMNEYWMDYTAVVWSVPVMASEWWKPAAAVRNRVSASFLIDSFRLRRLSGSLACNTLLRDTTVLLPMSALELVERVAEVFNNIIGRLMSSVVLWPGPSQ